MYNFNVSETPIDVRGGDTVFAVYSYVAETDEAINLVEGERLYILGNITWNKICNNINVFVAHTKIHVRYF